MDAVPLTEEAIVAFIEREYDGLARAVAMACGSMEMAEDAVQEALARAWERSLGGETFTHLGGWVVTVALNETRSRGRRQGAERRALDRVGARLRTSDVERGTAGADIDLGRAVARLPERQREAVVLHYLLDLDVATVARLLGVSAGTIKTALHRARAGLAERLQDEETERSLSPTPPAEEREIGR